MLSTVLSSLNHLRTTIPGVGVLLVVAGHYWTTGQFGSGDLYAVLAGFGLVAAEGK